MFSDTITLTIGGTPKVLNRIRQDGYSSEYLLRESNSEHRMFIRNTSYTDKKRQVGLDRHNVEVRVTVFPVAPATLSTVRKVYFVIENQQGDNLAESVNLAAATFAWGTASTNAALVKLMNQES
jgi:hypothetical protein